MSQTLKTEIVGELLGLNNVPYENLENVLERVLRGIEQFEQNHHPWLCECDTTLEIDYTDVDLLKEYLAKIKQFNINH